MILVITGTHEQPFNRLVQATDKLAGSKSYGGRIIIQYGYSTYLPQYAEGYELIEEGTLKELAKQAAIIITHGGPGSVWLAFELHKVPIVVPRMKRFGEHVDDHQLSFVRHLEAHSRIIALCNVDQLKQVISEYEEKSKRCSNPATQAEQNRRALKENLNYWFGIRARQP